MWLRRCTIGRGRRCGAAALGTSTAAAAAAAPRRALAAGVFADLRSDTVTRPTAEMRRAMAGAEVGDDVFGDDPTVARLEAEAAAMLGKEASVFVPSGTMANLLAIMVHCDSRGSECVVGSRSHICLYEQGGAASLAGVHTLQVPNLADGTLDADAVAGAVRDRDVHCPVTRLVCLENSQNECGGLAVPGAYTDSLAAALRERALSAPAPVALHVDGARLCHAAAALGETPERAVRAADTVSLCLSKGLASPVGSVLAGDAARVDAARRLRKALGGGMRQAGVLAACGMLSLEQMARPARLAEDNLHARQLAEALAALGPAVEVSNLGNERCTNMVYLRVDPAAVSPARLSEGLASRGVRALPFSADGSARFVTHYEITGDVLARVIAAFGEAMDEAAP